MAGRVGVHPQPPSRAGWGRQPRAQRAGQAHEDETSPRQVGNSVCGSLPTSTGPQLDPRHSMATAQLDLKPSTTAAALGRDQGPRAELT